MTSAAKPEAAVAFSQTGSSGISPRRRRYIMLLLSAGAAIIMTGFGIIMPIFARRLEDFGNGVETLGVMTMGFAIAQFALAPLVGSIADRIGRRPLIILAFAGYTLVNLGFLFAPNATVLTALRVFEGAITAGMMPSAMGIVGDIVPPSGHARWTGILMGSYGAGFTLGPLLGGVLYDHWGYAAPFIISAICSAAAMIITLVLLPETHTAAVRRRVRLSARREAVKESVINSLPRPLWVFGGLLILDFVLMFSFAFTEPQLVFYLYEELDFSSTQFGVLIMCYGLMLVAGQFGLSGLSDRFGRRPVIVTGMIIMGIFYLGLILTANFPLLLVTSIVSGLGEAIATPALAAVYLDLSDERHRSRIMGIRSSMISLAAVAGPGLVALVAGVTTSHQVFAISLGVAIAAAILAFFVLRSRAKPAPVLMDTRGRSEAAAAVLGVLTARARPDNFS